jgi:tRNA pseudouridine55 synthase
VTPLADAAAAAFPRLDVTEEEARRVAHGVRLPAAGLGARPPAGPDGRPAEPSPEASPATGLGGGPAAVFGPDGTLIALMREEDGQARSLAVFVP